MMVLLYIVSGVLVMTISMEFGQALASMLLDTGVLFTFSYFCLSLLKYRSRMVQMVSALAGVGIVYHLLAWPLGVSLGHQAQLHAWTGLLWLALLALAVGACVRALADLCLVLMNSNEFLYVD